MLRNTSKNSIDSLSHKLKHDGFTVYLEHHEVKNTWTLRIEEFPYQF